MVELRAANPGDMDAVLAVHRAAVRSVTTDRYTDEEVAAWAAAQDDPGQYPIGEDSQYIAVAETDDDGVVGFVGLDLADGVLETLYVHPTVQGEGTGTALLTHAEDTLRDHGHRVCVVAASRNAVPFYRRRGYSVEDEAFVVEMADDAALEFVRVEKTLD